MRIATTYGILRKSQVSISTRARLIIQINGTTEIKMHFSCNKNQGLPMAANFKMAAIFLSNSGRF